MNVLLVGSRSARQQLAIIATVCGLTMATDAKLRAQDGGLSRPGVYAMNADGGNFRLLVKLPGKWNGTPSFSHNATKLLFDASPVGKNFEQGHIYVMPADGPGDNPTDLGLGSTPSWSPDGKLIAFYIHNDNPDQSEPGVWIMNADGSERLWMCYGSAPRWCPDGKRLVLVKHSDETGDGIYLYDIEKNESEAVLNRTYLRIGGAASSPDGTRLAFISNTGGGAELIILPLIGGDSTGLVRLRGAIGWRPSWSSDGKYVVCWITGPNGRKQLHRVEVDTKREPELLAHQDEGRLNSDASWSSDGKQIVFMSDR